ncbi:Non-canonical non-ribosomal peptide synthetase FUB8 [Lachnellula cervina]|uniref:Non-canonical non-ribosomal peptide synthetase FUB8 n=1 Tax=Lachnellula cervina TaxID=1316786 RepID=A0A7D8USW9_9HELO|nr:Non-canonical non-ribosomal peptide synthetase FUB8 [Lachnellula cervina]
MTDYRMVKEGLPVPGEKKLLNNMVDYLALAKPQAPFAEYPKSPTTYSAGFQKINYATFANAVNGIAWWLKDNLGPSTSFETLAYIGPNDLRYNALVLGAVKVGYKILFTSPRNSIAAHVNLFDILDCKVILAPTPRPPPTTAILAEHTMQILEVPSVEHLITTKYPFFPFNKTFGHAWNEPLVVFHTSGSTGLPKPIIWTHGYASSVSNLIQMDPPEGYNSQERLYQANRVFVMFPPFHPACIAFTLFNAVHNQTVTIAPIQMSIPSAQGLYEALKYTKADVAFIVPSIVNEISSNQQLLRFISMNLDAIIYAGGDLPQSIGDSVASHIRLLNYYAATETGQQPLVQSQNRCSKKEWKYLEFHPKSGASFRHYAEDMYELYIVRNPSFEERQGVFHVFPALEEYGTRDLFVRHASDSKSHLWSFRARTDDIIVFLTGEKTNPISMEHHVFSRHQKIGAILVAGAQRFQASMLIEVVTDKNEFSNNERALYVEEFWPTIEEANRDCPAHARISKSHILICDPKKPMLRSGKQTVQRQATLQSYKQELDILYEDADKVTFGTGVAKSEDYRSRLIHKSDARAVRLFIREALLNIIERELDDNENFFVQGMDSLQALTLTRMLRQSMRLPTLSVSTIYAHPSISTLIKAVMELSKQDHDTHISDENARQQVISSTIKKFEEFIDEIPQSRSKPNAKTAESMRAPTCVILTGSTGSIGSYILDVLLRDNSVSHVYCLNRVKDSQSLQEHRNKSRGLPAQFPARKLTFLYSDLSQPQIGLDPEVYEELSKKTTIVIHTAWPVNFNFPLSSFEPHLAGLVNLIELATVAEKYVCIFYISSISSVIGQQSSSHIPEKVILDVSAPIAMGYAESKYICERLLNYASQKFPLNTAIARVGQVAGPVNTSGIWNKSEWLPSLVLSSFYLGCIPTSVGPSLNNVNWVPVDLLAEVIVELAFSSHKDEFYTSLLGSEMQARVFHPLNLHSTTWETICPIISKELSALRENTAGDGLKFTTLEKWVQLVQEDLESGTDSNGSGTPTLETKVKENPAAKLLGYFGALVEEKEGTHPGLDTAETAKTSSKLRALGEIQSEWIRTWIAGWMNKSIEVSK